MVLDDVHLTHSRRWVVFEMVVPEGIRRFVRWAGSTSPQWPERLLELRGDTEPRFWEWCLGALRSKLGGSDAQRRGLLPRSRKGQSV